ncbi:hypothetical protein Sjap_015181 [Stephania japonica]|uniref:Uncharacterized protein n=1 Tax=Stephania japonica TaxID=461633 RepID=A0AAP0IIM7_9MAGN
MFAQREALGPSSFGLTSMMAEEEPNQRQLGQAGIQSESSGPPADFLTQCGLQLTRERNNTLKKGESSKTIEMKRLEWNVKEVPDRRGIKVLNADSFLESEGPKCS